MLESDGFDDLVSRYEYLQRIEEQDSAIVGRVRDLRNEHPDTVERITEDARRDRRQEGRARAHPRASSRPARPSSTPSATRRPGERSTRSQPDIERLEGDIEPTSRTRSSSRSQAALRRAGVRRSGRRRSRRGAAGLIWPVNGTRRLPLRPALGPHARGHRHRRRRGHPDPRREAPGNVILAADTAATATTPASTTAAGSPPATPTSRASRSSVGASVAPGRGDRLRRLHGQLLRRPPALRDPGQRRRRRPAGLPVALDRRSA